MARYDIVAIGDTVPVCEQKYIQMLTDKGVTQTEQMPYDEITGTIAEIRSAVVNGTTQYYVRLEGDTSENGYYGFSAGEVPWAILLNVGDKVTISFYPAAGGICQPAFDVERLETAPGQGTAPLVPADDIQASLDSLNVPPIVTGSGLPLPQ